MYYFYLQIPHYERRLRTLEADILESKEQRRKAMEEVRNIHIVYNFV